MYIEGTLQYNWDYPDKEVTVHNSDCHFTTITNLWQCQQVTTVCVTDIPNKVALICPTQH